MFVLSAPAPQREEERERCFTQKSGEGWESLGCESGFPGDRFTGWLKATVLPVFLGIRVDMKVLTGISFLAFMNWDC